MKLGDQFVRQMMHFWSQFSRSLRRSKQKFADRLLWMRGDLTDQVDRALAELTIERRADQAHHSPIVARTDSFDHLADLRHADRQRHDILK